MKVVDANISIVFQGAVKTQITQEALSAARNIFPQATIILSTWAGENYSGLDYNKIVLNQDPGGITIGRQADGPTYNNTNRMLYSSQQGLKMVETPYVLKLRTDIILQDTEFLRYWEAYPTRIEKYQLFQHRILNYYLFAPQFSYLQGRKIPTLFHPSDWMFFGLTSDVKKLFDIPLQPEPLYSRWWVKHNKRPEQIDCWPEAVFRYAPEQYLFYSAIKNKFPNIGFESYMDISREKESLSKQIMANNFIILDYRQWHIKMPKYQALIGTIPYGQTSHSVWLESYKKYCDICFKIPWKEKLFKCLSFNILEILKTKRLELEKKFVLNLFPMLYKIHIKRKYSNEPDKLKRKMSLFAKPKKQYVYPEDIINEKILKK